MTPRSDRDKALIEQIEREVHDPNVPIANVLRLCVTLGGRTGSTALRDWATRELQGYPSEDDVPSYRVIGASLYIDNANRYGVNRIPQRISPQTLPKEIRESIREEVRFTEPIAVLEKRAGETEELRLTFGNSEQVAQFMTQEGWKSGQIPQRQVVAGVYWLVNPVEIAGVVDQVRTALTVLVAELTTIADSDDALTAADADGALSRAVPGIEISGDNNTVVVNHGANAQNTTKVKSAVSKGESEPDNRTWKVIGWVVAFIVALIGTIAGLGQWLDWDWFK
ncbi:AbiTii domain-containing protein [Microbispora sp. NPDC004025]